MSNLLLALQLLKQARQLLDAAEVHQETAQRLLVEASTLTSEAEQLAKEDENRD